MERLVPDETVTRSYFDSISDDDYVKEVQQIDLDFKTRLAANYYYVQKGMMSFEMIADAVGLETDDLALLLADIESKVLVVIEKRRQARLRFEASDPATRRVPPPARSLNTVQAPDIANCYDLSLTEKDMFTGPATLRNAAKKQYCARCLGKNACLDEAVRVVTKHDMEIVYGGLSGKALIKYVEGRRAAESIA